MKDCLAIILAGGQGTRLFPLTAERAKPAVPFGGEYRIIDITLSNCLNSHFKQILMLTQYKSLSLNSHVDRAWRKYFCGELDEFVEVVPPQQRLTADWYRGTADAVYQNIYSIEKANKKYTLILAGDHIYKMDYRELLEHHKRQRADLTVSALPVKQEIANQLGVMQVAADGRILKFEEKPACPQLVPGTTDICFASMGVYLFDTNFLLELLCRDAMDRGSGHDFGKDLIPAMIGRDRVFAYPFGDPKTGKTEYWRDVGTLDSYFEANMDLLMPEPPFDLNDASWPIRTFRPAVPAARIASSASSQTSAGPGRLGVVSNTILGGGRARARCDPPARHDGSGRL